MHFTADADGLVYRNAIYFCVESCLCLVALKRNADFSSNVWRVLIHFFFSNLEVRSLV